MTFNKIQTNEATEVAFNLQFSVINKLLLTIFAGSGHLCSNLCLGEYCEEKC